MKMDASDNMQDWFRRAKVTADGREQIMWDWVSEAIRLRKIVQRIEDRLPYHGESPVSEEHRETITLGGDEINEMRAALAPKGSGEGSSTHSLPTDNVVDALDRAADAILKTRYPHFADAGAAPAVRETTRAQARAAIGAFHDPSDEALRDALAAKLFGPDWVSKQQNASAALRALRAAAGDAR